MMHKLIRILAMILALILVCSCAAAEDALRGYNKENGYVYVLLGTYPQTAEGGVEPILWRVLTADDAKAYLCSEYVLEARRLHGDYKEYANKPTDKKKPGFNGDYTKTEMAQYLNGDFAANNFTQEELALLAPDEVLGNFFLLSDTDLKDKSMGFGTDKTRKAWGTEYAKTYKGNGDDLFVYGYDYGKHSPYWTRVQSTSDLRHARCTKQSGNLGRINVITVDLGMRPACYLNMTKVEIASGTGTMEDPFVLNTAR